MATYDSTTGIRALDGSNVISDIDTGFLSMATDVAALLGRAAGAMQEGVYDAGSYEVTQASGGAGPTVDVASNVGTGAFVANDSATGTLLRYVGPTVAKTTKTITTGHATLPRVDRIVLENDGDVTVVAGTATSGATLDNLTGAAAVPSNALLLADVHVPALDTTIANSQIRDRRKWARGANRLITRNADEVGGSAAGDSYSTTSNLLALIDSVNLAPRIECSGVPVRMTLTGLFQDSGDTDHYWVPMVDGVGADGMPNVGADPSSSGGGLQIPLSGGGRALPQLSWEFTPAAGSHILAPAWASAGGTVELLSNAARPCQLRIEEIVRQNTANNTTTSG